MVKLNPLCLLTYKLEIFYLLNVDAVTAQSKIMESCWVCHTDCPAFSHHRCPSCCSCNPFFSPPFSFFLLLRGKGEVWGKQFCGPSNCRSLSSHKEEESLNEISFLPLLPCLSLSSLSPELPSIHQ